MGPHTSGQEPLLIPDEFTLKAFYFHHNSRTVTVFSLASLSRPRPGSSTEDKSATNGIRGLETSSVKPQRTDKLRMDLKTLALHICLYSVFLPGPMERLTHTSLLVVLCSPSISTSTTIRISAPPAGRRRSLNLSQRKHLAVKFSVHLAPLPTFLDAPLRRVIFHSVGPH